MVALLDFGGGGTSITLADAASAFEPIEDTTRYTEFSGDQIDQALLNHVLEGITNAGGIDPAATAAVGSLTRLREECRDAKERLSAETVTELIAELPGYRSGIRVTRAELENLIAQPLSGVLTALENALERNRISWSNVSAVVTIGGGASIPLITQQLSEHSQAPVLTTPQPALDAAVGAALFAAFGADADAKTGVAPVVPVDVRDAGHAPGSATFRALAWSQDDDTADDVVPYTGDVYDTGGTAARPSVQYVPATEPIEEPRSTFNRLPQLVFGLAAVVAVVAVGGVAVALTSASDSTKATEPTDHCHIGGAHQRGAAAVDPTARPDRHGHQRAATATAAHDDGSAAGDAHRHHDTDHDRTHHHNGDNNHDNDHHITHDDHHNADDHRNHDDHHNATDDHVVHHRAVRAGAHPDSGAKSGSADSGSAVPISGPAVPVSVPAASSAALSDRLRDVARMVTGGHVR